MIRMMILPLSVVLLASSGHLYAAQSVPLNPSPDTCSMGLGKHIDTICSSRNATFLSLSDCFYTCKGFNSRNQITHININLEDGVPCGPCMECCGGICKRVTFEFKNPLTLKSCASEKAAA
uniref:Putative ixostatin n=1 Tax=Ixodes ricinus TaxID=34613 RepID=A0A0K8R4Q5_IXORI